MIYSDIHRDSRERVHQRQTPFYQKRIRPVQEGGNGTYPLLTTYTIFSWPERLSMQ